MAPATGAICVFAKAPAPGSAKTRLAGAVGEAGAAELARAFLIDTWRKVTRAGASVGARVLLVVAGDLEDLPPLQPAPEIVDQGEGDLGARLERTLRRELERSSWVVAIGTDSPTLADGSIRRACERLAAGAPAVLGPCQDGGFYLVGMRACPKGVFAGVPWSDASTREKTQAALTAAGLAPEQLEAWYDVDQPTDLDRLRDELASGNAALGALETLRVLRALEPEVSVIVPVLNEERRIAERLAELEPLAVAGGAEIIVVDGGSSDHTLEIAGRTSVARVLSADRGRAAQMNAGARAARGRVLVFLHADVTLPADALRWIRSTFTDNEVVAGAFRTWTVVDDASGREAPWLHLADVRSRYSGLPYGDQALFVRREAFFDAGGFPDLPLMEDLELALRLRERGLIRVVPARVRVSGRRFLAHPVRDTVLVNVFPLLYRLGVPAERLAKLYRDVR